MSAVRSRHRPPLFFDRHKKLFWGDIMLRKLILTVVLMVSGFVADSSAWAGDPAGSYNVTGSNPGGRGGYSGTVTVERTGDTFRVTWDIGNQTYVGTGIGSEKGIAVTYRSGNQTGLAIYGANGENWEGVWTYTGGREVGGEAWTRR
jgi:hypothetical protein